MPAPATRRLGALAAHVLPQPTAAAAAPFADVSTGVVRTNHPDGDGQGYVSLHTCTVPRPA